MDDADKLKQGLMVPKILWGAFLASQFMIAGVFYSVRPAAALIDPTLALILAILGTLMPFAAPVVRGLLPKPEADADIGRKLSMFFVPFIITLAMCESGTLFGCIAMFLGADLLYWLPPVVAGILSILLNFPGPGSFIRWTGSPRAY